MITKGTFGFIIGRKKRFMKVDDDANLLWRILVREIYVIMKHYGSDKELVKSVFEKIKVVKDVSSVKPSDIKKCQRFTDMSNEENTWCNLLQFCQSSFINILEAGHIYIDEDIKMHDDYRFEFDFNKWEARFYEKNTLLENASLDDIMGFEEMPTKSYEQIVSEMNEKFYDYYDKLVKIDQELVKLYKLKLDANSQSAVNIEEKVDKLIDDMKWELKELHLSRRVFYHRLNALDLIHFHF